MTASLSPERWQQIDDVFVQAKSLLTEQSPYWHVPIPVPIPTMARKIAGEILGWPLHLRNKPMDEDGQTAVVMPVMRHKPLGVALLPMQPKAAKPTAEQSNAMNMTLGANNPFALRSAFEASSSVTVIQTTNASFPAAPPSFPIAAAAPVPAPAPAPAHAPAPIDSEHVVGARVRKHFDGRDLEGTVLREDRFESGKFYLVLYDDGNQEHLTPHELALRKL